MIQVNDKYKELLSEKCTYDLVPHDIVRRMLVNHFKVKSLEDPSLTRLISGFRVDFNNKTAYILVEFDAAYVSEVDDPELSLVPGDAVHTYSTKKIDLNDKMRASIYELVSRGYWTYDSYSGKVVLDAKYKYEKIVSNMLTGESGDITDISLTRDKIHDELALSYYTHGGNPLDLYVLNVVYDMLDYRTNPAKYIRTALELLVSEYNVTVFKQAPEYLAHRKMVKLIVDSGKTAISVSYEGLADDDEVMVLKELVLDHANLDSISPCRLTTKYIPSTAALNGLFRSLIKTIDDKVVTDLLKYLNDHNISSRTEIALFSDDIMLDMEVDLPHDYANITDDQVIIGDEIIIDKKNIEPSSFDYIIRYNQNDILDVTIHLVN